MARVLLALLLVWLTVSTAVAYDAVRRWDARFLPVAFYVNPDGAPDGFVEATRRAAQTWTDVPTADGFGFRYAGTTSRGWDDLVVPAGANGFNDCVFNPTGEGLNVHVLAATFAWVDDSGAIVESDTVLNGRHAWGEVTDGHDVESAMLHELGHWIKLGDSSADGSVMEPFLAPGELRLAIGDDDVQGMRALYGSPSDAGASARPPVGAQSDGSTAAAAGAASGGGGAGGGGGGCFIATAACGTPLDPGVATLRAFRDRFLLTSAPGRAFVAWYYRWSPARAEALRESPAARALARVALLPLIAGATVCVATGVGPGWLALLLIGGSWAWRARARRRRRSS